MNIKLSQKQFDEISELLKDDIEDLANHPEFFEEMNYDPKDYIDKRIELCALFEIDFWNTADLYCDHFSFERMKALYNGQSLKAFNEQYESPNDAELAKGFLKALIKGKKNPK